MPVPPSARVIALTAHALGPGELPVPDWFVAYGGAALIGVTAVWLRATWTSPRLRAGAPATGAAVVSAPPRHPGLRSCVRVLGVVLLAGVLVCAAVGPDNGASNIAPVAVTVMWWVGLPLLCVLLGDVFATLSPFDSLVAVAERAGQGRRRRTARAPVWAAAAFLLTFEWFWLAYHRPGSARAVGVMVGLYSAAAVAAGLRWGRSWLREGEAFATLSSSLSALAPWRQGTVPSSAGLLAVAWLGGVAFDAVSGTAFWADVLGTATGWTWTLLNTVGLVWVTAVVGAAVLLATRLASAGLSDGAQVTVPELLATSVVPLALGWFIAHDLTLLLFEGQNFLFLASDPIGRGWDLLGSFAADTVDYSIVDAGWVRAVEVGALLAAHVGGLVLLHDRALRRLGSRPAMRVTWAGAALAATSLVAAVLLLLGGE